jgi:hypothetical protein
VAIAYSRANTPLTRNTAVGFVSSEKPNRNGAAINRIAMIRSKIACAEAGTDLISPAVQSVHAASTSTITPATTPVALAAPES